MKKLEESLEWNEKDEKEVPLEAEP